MKKLLIVFLIMSNAVFAASDKEPESKITHATVYLEGAQVFRESVVNLSSGKTTLKFKGLSPYIDKQSVKVKGKGDFTILSVTHTVSQADKTQQSAEVKKLKAAIESLNAEAEYKEVELNILKERKDFLNSNKYLLSKKVISPEEFKTYKEMFSTDNKSLQLAILEKQREIQSLKDKTRLLNQQVQDLNSSDELPTSEITVEVMADGNVSADFNISYYVGNAGWYPSYDMRVDDIDSPLKLSYKANVYQHTGIDWENVRLTFSNASPSESAVMPALSPYYLQFSNYYRKDYNHSNYNPNVREVSGVVRDRESGELIPFANVKVVGKTIGTTTDFDGKFTLAIPEGAKALKVSYVGYKPREATITSSNMTIELSSQALNMNSVVMTANGIERVRSGRKKKSRPVPVEMSQADYKTSFEFDIDIPYTLKSKATNLSIEMKETELNTSYVYQSVPKLSQQAYLTAKITDWEQHGLLDGEVNLYFEKTFVGKSVLDLAQMSDTLEVSLGADKSISVKREKQKDRTSRQFLGSNKVETQVWTTAVRNNKATIIRLQLYDQVPVSNDEDISVDTKDISGGQLNEETGEVIWEIELAPQQSIEKTIKYEVKYPKKKYLRID